MADTQTNNLGLYRIGAATDNVGVHMIEHYNANMTALDTFIAAHDIASISISGGTLTITATDGTTYTASIDADDINYSNSGSGLSATQIQAAIDEVVTALGDKQDTLTEGDNITINGNTISATDTKDADGISYDNADSGLSATNVQEAIDEVVTDLATKQDALTEGDGINIVNDTISADIENSLNSTSATKVLSANMGNRLASDIGTVEVSDAAAYAHAVGEYFINSSGQFVKVTTAIAVGDTIETGTNVSSTSVSAILSELNSNMEEPAMWLGTLQINSSTSKTDFFTDLCNLFKNKDSGSWAIIMANISTISYSTGIAIRRNDRINGFLFPLATLSTALYIFAVREDNTQFVFKKISVETEDIDF